MQLARRLDYDPTTQGRQPPRRRRATPVRWEVLQLPLGEVSPEVWARAIPVPQTTRLRLVGARRLPSIGSVTVEEAPGVIRRWSVHQIPGEISAADFRVAGEARVLVLEDGEIGLPLEPRVPHLLIPEADGAEAVVTLM